MPFNWSPGELDQVLMDLAVLRKAEVLVWVAVLALKLNSASASESYLEAALDSPNGGLFNALAI